MNAHVSDFQAVQDDRRARPRKPHRLRRRALERVRLLGEAVDLIRPEEVMHHVQAWVAEGRKALVANHNLNSMKLVRENDGMRRFYDQADMIEVDSTPLIWFARLIGLHSRPLHRCTYLDWREHFWSVANRSGWKVLYLGGAPGVAEAAVANVAARYPGARILARHGYFDAAPGSAENASVVAQIEAFQPDVLFVGMGMPRQEAWIMSNLDALPDCVIFSVGAAFDYEAGVQKSAPRWMGQAGLEWLYRLLCDPKRLARRYLYEPWALTPRILSDVTQAARRRLKPARTPRNAPAPAGPPKPAGR
ncbi:glycosyl transferase [Brevundimonas sp. Leaf363]|uniref:WecB/TagA/CpsF family glycosyltransferase n=1 Tax=Brevundimonas sp. Leaf363 TaxID=1736353 RepID=UPI0006FB8806|nr:WecB/TagA/CpsF family glycosyltransferase [Brevundimonas sp. Leaf363]KQS55163.1 glycosyl transferase [Brevundimonas sp. Leaf363]